jgi:hypothetical protein
MKPFSFAVFVTLVVTGVLLYREAVSGFLEAPERALSGVITRALGGKDAKSRGVTLVVQGGISVTELSPLDVALFTRAASRLGASTVAVSAWRLPESPLSLAPPAWRDGRNVSRFVGGTLLLMGDARSGEPPAALETSLPAETNFGFLLSEFIGFHTSFPAGTGWSTGFLNLPDTRSEEPLAPVVALLEGRPVLSFSALCALPPSSKEHPTRLIPPSGTNGAYLLGDGWRLPLRADGTVALNPSRLRNVARLDMDDLLLAAERIERGLPADAATLDLVADRIVILGTLASDDAAGAAAGGRRKFSLAEYQSLVAAHLLACIEPVFAPWPGALACIVFCVGAAWLLWRASITEAALVAIASFCFWLLIPGALFAAAGFAIPVLLPLGLLATALLLRICS